MHFTLFHRISRAMVVLALAACCALPVFAAGRKVEHRVAPVYPELAKRMHIGGLVRVAATIAPDGSVTQAKAISGNKLLEGSAEAAIRQWRFAPYARPSKEDIVVNFVESE